MRRRASGLVLGVSVAVCAWSATALASSPVWQRVTTPSPATSASLDGVSCVTAKDCVAVGGARTSTTAVGLVETWNGAHWRVVSTPRVAGSALLAVSCPSATSCVAVGAISRDSTHQQPFSEVLSGSTWTVHSTAVLTGEAPGGGSLVSVSCEAVNACVAVGTVQLAHAAKRSLIEQWNGQHWTRLTAPVDGGRATSLASVSCLPDTKWICAAGGSEQTGSDIQPLVEASGVSSLDFSVIAVPAVPSSRDAALSAISCPQPTSCAAVGSTSGGAAFSEIDSLNHWVRVATATPTGADNYSLDAVSCPISIQSCRAVGAEGRFGGELTVAETFNGSHWAVQSSADTPSNLDTLAAVSCPLPPHASLSCAAVGHYTGNPTSSAAKTLALRN